MRPLGFGGNTVGNSALGMRMANMVDEVPGDLAEAKAYDAMGGKGAMGKGAMLLDSELAMCALEGGRVINKVDVKAPYVEYKGYRGGDSEFDSYFFSNYSTDDAVALMNHLDFGGNLLEAKQYIGSKIQQGNEDILSDFGITPAPFDNHECKTAFDDSGYTMRDARRAVATFPFLHDVAQAKEYLGLKIINGNENILKDVGIASLGNLKDLFARAGYTLEDAEAAVEAFSFLNSVHEAKEYIGLRPPTATRPCCAKRASRPATSTLTRCSAPSRRAVTASTTSRPP